MDRGVTLKRPRLVYIRWIDATSRDDWFTEEDAEKWAAAERCAQIVEQVGWVMKEMKEGIVLASGYSTVGELRYGTLMFIPAGMIQKIQTLKVPK